jgi:RNA polymerase sigma factor (sigma-70 family)
MQRSVEERNALVSQHIGLVYKVVESRWHVRRVRLLGWDEAFAVGCLHLLLAAAAWKESSGYPFRYYATVCVRRGVLRAANCDGVIAVRHHLTDRHPDEWTAEEAKVVRAARGCIGEPRRHKAHRRHWKIALTAESESDWSIRELEDAELLRVGFAALDRRESKVVRRWFRGEPDTRIADDFGLTHQRVQQIRTGAVAKMRERLGVR